MNRVAFNIFGFNVYYYSLCILLGVIVAYILITREGKNEETATTAQAEETTVANENIGDGLSSLKIEDLKIEPDFKTNVYEYLKNFKVSTISTKVLGMAFEPEQYYENPDGTPITFDSDYFGNHRKSNPMVGPFEVVNNAISVAKHS